jgi:uncharacterized membrane protein
VRRGPGKRIFGAVGAVLLSLGMIGTSLTAYLHIREGHGAEPFQNYLGQVQTWASATGGAVGGLLILLGGVFLGWWQLRRRSRQEGVSVKELRRELKRDP